MRGLLKAQIIMKKSKDIKSTLRALNIAYNNAGTSTGSKWMSEGNNISSFSPVDANEIAKVSTTTAKEFKAVISTAAEAFKVWRTIPAPKRGEIVRQFGERLRVLKNPLGELVSYEMGKSLQVNGFQTMEQAVGIGRNTHAPLCHFFSHNWISSALREPIDNFVICQYSFQFGTPIYFSFSQISQSVFEQYLLLFFF